MIERFESFCESKQIFCVNTFLFKYTKEVYNSYIKR